MNPSHPDHDAFQLHRLLSAAMLAIVIGLIPWTAFLAITLPRHFRAHDWRLAWVGFDAALIAVLIHTAWAAWFRRQVLLVSTIVGATMLICDAWFDVNTSFGTKGELLTIITALLGNLPLAVFFIWLARQIMARSAHVIYEHEGLPGPPRHLSQITFPFATTWQDPRRLPALAPEPPASHPAPCCKINGPENQAACEHEQGIPLENPNSDEGGSGQGQGC